MRHILLICVLIGLPVLASVVPSGPMGAAILSGLAGVFVLWAFGWAQGETNPPDPPLSARLFDRHARSGQRGPRQNPPGGRPVQAVRDG